MCLHSKRHLKDLLPLLGLGFVCACIPAPPPAIRLSEATAPPQSQAEHGVPPAGTAVVAVRAAPSATPVPSPGPRLDEPGRSLGVVAEPDQGAHWAAIWSSRRCQLSI